jgi:hypothetical protein
MKTLLRPEFFSENAVRTWSKSAFFALLGSFYVLGTSLADSNCIQHVPTKALSRALPRVYYVLYLNYALITFLQRLERPFYACTIHLSRSDYVWTLYNGQTAWGYNCIYSSQHKSNMSKRYKRAKQEWEEEGLDMNQWLYEIWSKVSFPLLQIM